MKFLLILSLAIENYVSLKIFEENRVSQRNNNRIFKRNSFVELIIHCNFCFHFQNQIEVTENKNKTMKKIILPEFTEGFIIKYLEQLRNLDLFQPPVIPNGLKIPVNIQSGNRIDYLYQIKRQSLSNKQNKRLMILSKSREVDQIYKNRENEYVPKLFHFLQLNRHQIELENQKELLFENKNLTQIVRQLALELNKEQVQYNKIYVGNLCNFILVIKKPRYSNFLSLLTKTFYSNLTVIFQDVARSWKQNQTNEKNQVSRAKIIAFLKILTEVHLNKKNYPRKVFSQRTLCVLRTIDPTKDQKLLRLFLKIIFQCQDFINNSLKVEFAQILYSSLKCDYFPRSLLNKTLKFVLNQLTHHYLQSYEFKNQIVTNCRKILIQNLRIQDQGLDLEFFAFFLNSISSNSQKAKLTLTHLSQLCTIVKNAPFSNHKISCLKELVKNVEVNERQSNIQMLLSFLPSNQTTNFSFSTLIPEVLKKVSSGCLLQLATSEFTQKISNIIKDKNYQRAERFSALQVYKTLSKRMQETNFIIYEHMIKSLGYLKEVFDETKSSEVEQAFKLEKIEIGFQQRLILN